MATAPPPKPQFLAHPPTHPPAPPAAPTGGRALLAGTVLAEFEFGPVLAESRFAIVYLATDHALDRPVAIKEYLPASLTTRSEGVKVQLRSLSHAHAFERGRRAFIDEAKQLARCEHPALLRVHRLLHANGTVYRVMPHCPGTPLLAMRQQMHAPPDESALRALLHALLGALATLHRHGLVHGEVTPANIVLLADEQPLLLDFGAVRRSIVGDPTRSWMSVLGGGGDLQEHEADAQHANAPFRWPRDGPAGPWNDVSALAAVLYHWITGHWPEYPPAEPLSRVVARLRDYLPQLDYSAALLRVIDAALAPKLQDRPQSVAQFRACLDAPAAAPLPASASASAPAPALAPLLMPVPVPVAAAAPPLLTDALQPTAQPPQPAQDAQADAPEPGPPEAVEAAAAAAAVDEPLPRLPSRSSGSSRAATQQRQAARKRRLVLTGATALGLALLGSAGWQLHLQRQNDSAQALLVNATRPGALAGPADPLLAADPTGAGLRLPASTPAATPSEVCSGRAPPALLQCLLARCAEPAWSQHAQCQRLRNTGQVD